MANLPPQALELLDAQYGLVGRHQLLDFMTRGQIDGLVQRGELVPRIRGQYTVRGAPEVPEQAPMAAQLRGRPDACITGPFVLGLLGVDGFSARDPFELLVVPGRHLSNVDFPYRTNPTPGTVVAKHGRLRVVTVTAALVDVPRSLDTVGERRLRVGYDFVRARNLTSHERMRQRAAQLGPADPGAAWWTAFLDEEEGTLESEGERRVAPLLRRFRPAPEPQVWVSPRRRVDWFWRSIRLALEYLGAVDHRGDRARLADERRDAELERLNIETVPIVARDLDEADGLLAYLEAIAVRRAFELGVEAPRLA